MEITGKLTKLFEHKIFIDRNEKDSKKLTFLVETDEKYNNLYFFNLFGYDRVTKFLEDFKCNDMIKIKFSVKTNEYKGNYYTNLMAWHVSKVN